MHLRQVRVHKNTEINTVSIYPKKAFRNANNYMLLVLWYCLCDDVNWILSFAGEKLQCVCACLAPGFKLQGNGTHRITGLGRVMLLNSVTLKNTKSCVLFLCAWYKCIKY